MITSGADLFKGILIGFIIGAIVFFLMIQGIIPIQICPVCP